MTAPLFRAQRQRDGNRISRGVHCLNGQQAVLQFKPNLLSCQDRRAVLLRKSALLRGEQLSQLPVIAIDPGVIVGPVYRFPQNQGIAALRPISVETAHIDAVRSICVPYTGGNILGTGTAVPAVRIPVRQITVALGAGCQHQQDTPDKHAKCHKGKQSADVMRLHFAVHERPRSDCPAP